MSEKNQSIQSGRGGARKGAGRKPGAITQRTRDIANGIIEDGGVTPLEYMLQVMREEVPEEVTADIRFAIVNRKFEAAKAAAPYIHPRLAAMTVSGDPDAPLQMVGKITLVGVRAG